MNCTSVPLHNIYINFFVFQNDLNSVIATTTWIGHAIFHNNLSLLKLKHSCITQHIMRTITRNSMSYEIALSETMVRYLAYIGFQMNNCKLFV